MPINRSFLKGAIMCVCFVTLALQIISVTHQDGNQIEILEVTDTPKRNKMTIAKFLSKWEIARKKILHRKQKVSISIEDPSYPLNKNWFNEYPNISQDDASLLEVVRRDFIQPPIPTSIPYDFKNYSKFPECDKNYILSELERDDFNPSCGQVQALEIILRRMSPGFYLDAGANDGVFISNTLWLERKLGWSGLLVEADPGAFANIVSVKRKAWLSPTCLSLTSTPKRMKFYVNPKYSEASGLIKSAYYGATEPVDVQCLPVTTLLLALNRTVVDFFTLDVEGNEMEILDTIPFDKITFKVLAIEHLFVKGGKKTLREFMERKGYRFYRTVVQKSSGDSIFLHPSVVLNEEELKQLGHEDKEKFVGDRT